METRSQTGLPLLPGHYYHLYNRANGAGNLFQTPDHYLFFLKRLARYSSGYFDLFAYCLIPNHFHLLIRPLPDQVVIASAMEDYPTLPKRLEYSIEKYLAKTTGDSVRPVFSLKDLSEVFTLDKDLIGQVTAFLVSEQFRKLFMSYSKAVNKQMGWKGSLFQKYFKRKSVESTDYLRWLIWYIHRNPVHHDLVRDFRTYTWSSYASILSRKPTRLPRREVISWFENEAGFLAFHDRAEANWKVLKELVLE
ncbi:hypothetical protein [Flavilitoribacter nigricans]|uniref:Transposase IS200-like domain-containing protein n=1 Tax=Flavilitoribacter nigricans (strain ATCC 23147 / DSM 23189 / NBRC 102662 / NCIMB 1420 / SS-2) TaxID=1122177 RepID=A0A2D0NKL9_FLAN2|nr:hypothetical protein [Flavilitoribacter nigricans]PHN08283.1 hypothetical protein CRP01_02885 [Flavilitoribacter nigricans DSM 23189 = NBRC 102662]